MLDEVLFAVRLGQETEIFRAYWRRCLLFASHRVPFTEIPLVHQAHAQEACTELSARELIRIATDNDLFVRKGLLFRSEVKLQGTVVATLTRNGVEEMMSLVSRDIQRKKISLKC